MKEKVVVIGAGSAMFTRGMVADLIRHKWDAELALVDIDPQALAVAEKLSALMIGSEAAPIRLTANTDRRAVLRDATAVICTIGVGGRRAWEQDVFIPRKYGIYQPVGDSVAPGGTSRALRMIPAMVEIAKDVQDLAPEALFFNYGNPMSAVCRGVRKATGADMVGLCHGVFHGERYLADALGLPVGSLRGSYAGMNHLAWFTGLRQDGVGVFAGQPDILPHRGAGFAGVGHPVGGGRGGRVQGDRGQRVDGFELRVQLPVQIHRLFRGEFQRGQLDHVIEGFQRNLTGHRFLFLTGFRRPQDSRFQPGARAVFPAKAWNPPWGGFASFLFLLAR